MYKYIYIYIIYIYICIYIYVYIYIYIYVYIYIYIYIYIYPKVAFEASELSLLVHIETNGQAKTQTPNSDTKPIGRFLPIKNFL